MTNNETKNMTSKTATVIAFLALIFPLFVLGGLWAKAATHRDYGQQVWRVKMTGYDPRDVLYGHYLRFRFDWNMPIAVDEKALADNMNVCMCLNESDEGITNPVAMPMLCDAPETGQCQSLMKVAKNGRFYSVTSNEATEKYFIPEDKAQIIERLFRQSTKPFYMELMAHEDQSVSVRGMYVGDQKIEDYVRYLDAK